MDSKRNKVNFDDDNDIYTVDEVCEFTNEKRLSMHITREFKNEILENNDTWLNYKNFNLQSTTIVSNTGDDEDPSIVVDFTFEESKKFSNCTITWIRSYIKHIFNNGIQRAMDLMVWECDISYSLPKEFPKEFSKYTMIGTIRNEDKMYSLNIKLNYK